YVACADLPELLQCARRGRAVAASNGWEMNRWQLTSTLYGRSDLRFLTWKKVRHMVLRHSNFTDSFWRAPRLTSLPNLVRSPSELISIGALSCWKAIRRRITSPTTM